MDLLSMKLVSVYNIIKDTLGDCLVCPNLIFLPGVNAMIYYVDSKFGKAENDGLSRQFPLRGIEQVNALKLHAGDTVLFKCGQEFVGCLHPRRADNEGMITFDSYGFGEKPVIKGDSPYAVFLSIIHQLEV